MPEAVPEGPGPEQTRALELARERLGPKLAAELARRGPAIARKVAAARSVHAPPGPEAEWVCVAAAVGTVADRMAGKDPPRKPLAYLAATAVSYAEGGLPDAAAAAATPADRKRLAEYKAFVRDFRAAARGLRFVPSTDGERVSVVGPDGKSRWADLVFGEQHDLTRFAPLIRADLERGGQPGTV